MRRRIWRNSGQDPQVLSGLDLIAKIWPESDSVYDLTAIDSSTFKRVMGMAPRHYRNKRQPGLVLPLRKNLDQYDLERGNPSPSNHASR
jgi:hypothetical protein